MSAAAWSIPSLSAAKVGLDPGNTLPYDPGRSSVHHTTWERLGIREVRARWRPVGLVAFLLDTLIAIYATTMVVSALTDADLGVLTTDHLEKSILVLLVAVPLRVALGGRSWLIDLMARARPDIAALRARTIARVPASIVDSLTVIVASRLATFVIGFIAILVFPAAKYRGWQMPFEHRRFAETFAAWDSGWYFDIAKRGYYFLHSHQSSIAFFPLYPLTMRVVAWPFGASDRALWISGIVVSCVAFVLAMIELHRFTERVFGSREVARRAVLYLAVFPFSLFFTRVYTESIFLLTTLLAISRAWDKRWVQAGLWGAAATLCRPNGILIGVPLVLLALELDNNPPIRTIAKRLVCLLPVPLALAAFCAYNYHLSGDPFAWLTAQATWGNSIGAPPWRLLLKLIGRMVKHGFYDYFFVAPDAPFRFFHGFTALLFIVMIPSIFKRLGLAMGAYVLVSLLVPLSAAALEGIGRYASVLFPAFMLLGTVKSQRVHETILVVSALFLALFVCLFVTLRPIY